MTFAEADAFGDCVPTGGEAGALGAFLVNLHPPLFLELLLHKMLLRPKSRDRRGRTTKHSLGARFKTFAQGDYQFLVRGLVNACKQ